LSRGDGSGVTADAPDTSSFVRLCVIGFLAYCSYAVCRTPLLPVLARDLGATPPLVGFVVGASTLTGILVKLPAGAWSDVLGRRPLLVAGTVVFATLPFTYLGVASLGALLALRFIHGAATAIFGPVASASLSDIAPAERRAAWLSTYAAVQGTGQAIGPVIAGYLIASGRYNVAFISAGLIAAATPLLASGWPGAGTASKRTIQRGQFVQGVREILRHRLILMTSVAQSAQFVLNGTLSAFLPLFALDVIGLVPAQLGLLFALQTVTTLATRPLMGIVSDRVGRRSVIVAGLTVCSGAVWFVSQAAGPVTLVAAVLTYAVGVAGTTAATSAFITDLSHRARYGAAHGVFGTIYDVGDAFGPIAAGLLVASVGYVLMFQVMAVVALTVTAVFYVVSRRTDGPRFPER
jgi:MFS family permease